MIKKFLSFSVGTWLSIVIGLISTPIMTRVLSPADFGKISIFTLVINLLLLVSLTGSDQSFVRFFADEEKENRKYLLWNCIKIPLFTFGVVSVLIIIFNRELLFYIFSDNGADLLIATLVMLLVQIINRFAFLVVRMEQRGLWYSFFQVIIKVLDLSGFFLLAIFLGFNYKTMLVNQIFYLILVTVCAISVSKNSWEFFSPNVRVKKYDVRTIFIYGSPLLVTLLFTWVFQSIDRFALKQLSNDMELGLYAVAFKIIGILNIIQTSFTTFWVPVSYEKYAKEPENYVFFAEVSKLVSFGMIFIAIVTIMFKDFLIVLLGPPYREALFIVPFLVFIPVMYTISETTVIGINFAKRNKWHIIISIICCLSNIIGNWLLIPIYGGKGAAISTGVSYILFMFLRTQFSLRYFPVNYELKKIYSLTTMVAVYAFLATFSYIALLSSIIIGLTLIAVSLVFYYSTIKQLLLLRRKNVGIGSLKSVSR